MKIFVSYTSNDLPIARAICRELNNAFEGNVDAVYAKDFLKPGSEWKRSIRDRLEDSNAMISILTKNSIDIPWIYVEWATFWINGKATFLLLDDALKIDEIIEPMRDIQIVRMSDVSQMKDLIAQIADAAGVYEVPYGKVDLVVNSLKSAQMEIAAQSMDAYLDPSHGLPKSDVEKFKVACYFLDTRNYIDLRRVCAEIRDDAYIFQICSDLINEGVDEVVADLASLMKRPTRVANLAEIIFERKQHDTELFSDLLERIADDDQTVLTSLFKISFRDNVTRDRIFSLFFRHFSNLPEVRKVAIHLAVLNEDTESRMLSIRHKFEGENYAELRKLILSLNDLGKVDKSYFREMVKMLREKAPRQFEILKEGIPDLD